MRPQGYFSGPEITSLSTSADMKVSKRLDWTAARQRCSNRARGTEAGASAASIRSRSGNGGVAVQASDFDTMPSLQKAVS
eukprot:1115079-Pleurochrysis_carterae.AAC.2